MTANAGEDVGEMNPLSLLVRLQTGKAFWKSAWKIQKAKNKCHSAQLYHSWAYAQRITRSAPQTLPLPCALPLHSRS